MDIDYFLTFMAIELMTCHWDGYCNNRNNYRIYIEPKTKKAYVFPHGMDQMFGDREFRRAECAGGLLANVIMTNPNGGIGYRDLWAATATVSVRRINCTSPGG